MYTTLAKTQAFPLATRVYPNLRCFKPNGCHPFRVPFTTHGFYHKSHEVLNFVRPATFSTGFQYESSNIEFGEKSSSTGFRLKTSVRCCSVFRVRSYSTSSSQKVGGGKAGKPLPWLSSSKVKVAKGLEKGASPSGDRSSWGKSVKRLEKVSDGSSWDKSTNRSEKGSDAKSARSVWAESLKRSEKGVAKRTSRSYWEDSVETLAENSSNFVGDRECKNGIPAAVEAKESLRGYNDKSFHVEEEDEGREESEDEGKTIDPRWDRIKTRFQRMEGVKRAEKPEFQRWTKQENWGKRTWKEATESTVPKMVGEGVYGVGPVLAALSAGRREFYVLYIQGGLDLSSNHRKKREKKGFEKILRMAEQIGLSIKEVSKHDLNMVVDNRPHQGLVLDASPLEMVNVKELDRVSSEEEKGSLWVALDEVTDPQNLGAIIRSAYFFGATGVVVCAKNSAPLSGVVSKASAGSLEVMELRRCKNMMQFLVSSTENGWRVLGGSVSSKAVPLSEVLPGEPTILVLGSEGTGLRPLVERSCTELVRIPGNFPADITLGRGDDTEAEETNLDCSTEEFRSFLAVESLNVSVAAGVLLHHLIGKNQNGSCVTEDTSENIKGRRKPFEL